MTKIILSSMLAICNSMKSVKDRARCYAELIICPEDTSVLSDEEIEKRKQCFRNWAEAVKD